VNPSAWFIRRPIGTSLLAVAITANFAGLFELPGLSIERGGGHMGAFGTGLLAAFAAPGAALASADRLRAKLGYCSHGRVGDCAKT
jgi:hypothetical protein